MHKVELANKIARKTDLDERGALTVLNMVLDEIRVALKKGERVTLTGFGTFVILKKKKRTIHNIDTDGPFVVPAHKAVGFKVGSILKKAVKK